MRKIIKNTIIYTCLIDETIQLFGEEFVKNNKDIFVEVPLLFEVDWDEYFDVNVLVISNLDLVYKRLEERGLDIQEIENRLNNQMDVEEKLKRADKIIYNNGSLDDLYVAVDKIIEEILC